MRKYPRFPFFLRQSGILKRDPNRKSFCSVSKIYSYACKIEAEEGIGNFSNSQPEIDKLFADPGFLMKDNKSIFTRAPAYFSYTNPSDGYSPYELALERVDAAVSAFKAATEADDFVGSNYQYLRETPGMIQTTQHNGRTGREYMSALENAIEDVAQWDQYYAAFLPETYPAYLNLEEGRSPRDDIKDNPAELIGTNAGLYVAPPETVQTRLWFYNQYRFVADKLRDGQTRNINFLNPNFWATDQWGFAVSNQQLDANAADLGILYFAQETEISIQEIWNKKNEHISNLRHQQRFGLNYFYNTALELSNFKDRISASSYAPSNRPSRLKNKMAISLANILHWSKQRRIESFWGQTTKKEWLNLDPIGDITRETGRRGYMSAGSFVPVTQEQYNRAERILVEEQEQDPVEGFSLSARRDIESFEEDTGLDFLTLVRDIRDQVEAGEQPHYEDLQPEYETTRGVQDGIIEHYFTTYESNASNTEIKYLISFLETPDILCGFSPFLGDDRYHPDEIIEAYKQNRLQNSPNLINAATLRDDAPNAFATYKSEINSLINFLQTKCDDFKLISSYEDVRESSKFYDDIFSLNGTAMHKELERFERYFQDMQEAALGQVQIPENYVWSSDFLYHILDFAALLQLSNDGFTNISRGQKILTILSKDQYNLMRESTTSMLPRVNFGNMYRFGFGTNFSNIIQDYAKKFLRLNILRQHDSWVCALEDTGLYYFYNEFRNTFMTALYRSVDSVFGSSVIKKGVRLIHNTPNEDCRTLFTSIISHVGENAYGNLSNEERSYKMIIDEQTERHLNCHPLASYEEEIGFQNFSIANIESKFADSKQEMIEKMIAEPDSRLILEYIFPIKRYMSIATIYSTSILGGFGAIPADPRTRSGLFTGTKASLASVFHVCSLSPNEKLDYLAEVSQSEMLKMGLQSSMSDGSSLPCFDFPFDAALLEQFLEDLLDVIKQMPSIVLRGIANQIDPAYKEMRYHYANCNLKNLRNSDLKFHTADNNNELPAGLVDRTRRTQDGGQGDGKYAPIFPTAIADMASAIYMLTPGTRPGHGLSNIRGWRAMSATVNRILSFSIGGPLSMPDLAFAFSVPCMEVDEGFDLKWRVGKYGRYGHPITPLTLLALSTAEINAEREMVTNNCADLTDEDDLCDDDDF